MQMVTIYASKLGKHIWNFLETTSNVDEDIQYNKWQGIQMATIQYN